MNNIQDTFFDYFDKIYKKSGYLDKYGGDVVISVMTIVFFFLIYSYFYIQSKIEPIRQNWANERCKPEVMAFAGIINKPDDKSALEYTSENFMMCTNEILSNIIGYFVKPYYYIVDLLVKLMNTAKKAINVIRMAMAILKNKLKKIFQYLVGRVVNIMIPLQKILIKLKDTLQKTVGVLVTGLYTVYGAYLALKAFIGAFLTIVIIALVVLVAVIIAFWVLPFTWPLAATSTAFFLLISIHVAIIAGWMVHILNISSRRIPNKPSAPALCFDKNTSIKTINGDIKIKDIKPGTILKNGDKITATFKLSINNEKMFNLDNIIVSSSHKVFHDKLGWIFIKDHPSSIKIENYREPYIYCINTETKRIKINNHKFLDWDDLEPIDIIKLKNLNYLKNNSSLSDIHRFLDSGLSGDILIELENGLSTKLKNIKVNDQLYNGERVLGVVKIDTKNISQVKKYTLKNFEIIGAPNLHFKDLDLGNFNTLNMKGKPVKKPKLLYHLVTDTGFFNINSYKIRDYNSALENILDIREKLYSLF